MEESTIIKITNDSNRQKERFNNLGLKKFKVIKYIFFITRKMY